MKTFIKNRDGQKICVVMEGSPVPGKLAFVMHGLSGNKSQRHIRTMAEAFLESGYAVVTFDTTNTFGESDGDYENATVSNYYTDLETVIDWSIDQSWYVEPFVLCGHSLGGLSTALYAELHPGKVRALAPISTVISGQLSIETYGTVRDRNDLEDWKRTGWQVTTSHDGKTEKRLPWSHMEDRLRYDLLSRTEKLTMPVLLIAGEHDTSTPPAHQQVLYDKLPAKKEFHVIAGSGHTFYEPNELAELKRLIKAWIQQI